MATLSLYDARSRNALPDTPPELVSPTSTTFSSRSSPSAEALWASRTLASMPVCALPHIDSGDKRAEQHVNSSNQTHQTLPSFSTLFSSSVQASPLLRNPEYTAQSSRERQHSQSGAYSLTVGSQPRTTFEAIADSRRPSHHDISSQNKSFPSTVPLYLSGPASVPVSPSQATFEAAQSQAQGPITAHGDQDPHQPNLPPNQSSPSTEVPAEVPVPRFPEGMGPRIWTGYEFLPQFVRAEHVPGEGLCYFYDDGSHCKSVIDGDPVNPHWGVTKAGKPRKRLAIACLTCREKKIKCDPDFPRCSQCQKFNRTCKFKNQPRGGQNSQPPSPSGSNSQVPRRREEDGLEASASSFKRLRVNNDSYSESGDRSPGRLSHNKSPLSSQQRDEARQVQRLSEETLLTAWKSDPCARNADTVEEVVTRFFIHCSSAMILRFLPEDVYKSWLGASPNRKRPEDLMLLYSILAVGTTLSNGPQNIADEYAQVAAYATKHFHYSCIQVVQTNILLAVYYLANNRLQDASELLSSATATASTLQLHIELDRSADAALTTFPMGMSRSGYAESRRRTLWSLFMLERVNGMFPDRPAMLNPGDIHSNLPGDAKAFARQLESHMPLFDAYDAASSKAVDCTEASLVDAVHIWAECQAAVFRAVSRPSMSSHDERKLHALSQSAYTWHSSLPTRLSFSNASFESAMYTVDAGSILAINVLYHHAMIKVNRYHHGAASMRPETQNNFIVRCREHAWTIVDMIRHFEDLRKSRPSSFQALPHFIITAASDAIDVLTAAGPIQNVTHMMENTIAIRDAIRAMASVWGGADGAVGAICYRLEQLDQVRSQGSHACGSSNGLRIIKNQHDGSFRWIIPEPLETRFPRDMDVVYI